MSEFLEDELEKVALEVNDLQQQYDKFLADNKQREAAGVAMAPARQAEGEDLLRRLNEARQRQTPLLLLSILQSSDRLELSTRNLQQSSESQVKVAESQVKVSESQARTMDDLLKSSHRLEQFAIYLLVMTAVNIFIVEYTTNLFSGQYGFVGFVGLLVGITAMMAIAFRWPSWIRRKPKIT